MLASPIALPLAPPAPNNDQLGVMDNDLSVPATRCAVVVGAKLGHKMNGAFVKSQSARPYSPEKVAMDASPAVRPPVYHRDDDAHPDLRKTRMCPNYTSASRCPLSSDKCKFAHSNEELRVSYDRYYKVQPCAFFDRGKCRNGEYCRFAHGYHELRVTTPVTPSTHSVVNSAQTSSGTTTSANRESPLMVPQNSLERGNKTFDLASFLSTQQQRHKRQSLVSFVGSRHSRRRSDATGQSCSGDNAVICGGGRDIVDEDGASKADAATSSGESPDGSPLGARSSGFSSNDTWSDCSPLTLLSSDGSPARLSVHSATSSSLPNNTVWDNARPFPTTTPPPNNNNNNNHNDSALLSAAIHLSLTSSYKD